MRTVLFSSNGNSDYLFFAPLTAWCWRQFDWFPRMIYAGDITSPIFHLVNEASNRMPIYAVPPLEGYLTETVSQISRLYGSTVIKDQMIMTSDVDMIPLSNYWDPKEGEITLYGYDLTDYTQHPICYAAMMAYDWDKLMQLNGSGLTDSILNDLDKLPNAKASTKWETRWFQDQALLTDRVNQFNGKKIVINRGKYSNGYATGRMDRGNWNYNHTSFTDAHLFQQLYFKQNQDKFDKTMELLTSIWPDEDFGWWIKYTEEFRKLTGHS